MKNTKETLAEKLLYRKGMCVTEVEIWQNGNVYPVCPRCGITIEREYQSFCDRCGQKLNWKEYPNAKVRYSRCLSKKLVSRT